MNNDPNELSAASGAEPQLATSAVESAPVASEPASIPPADPAPVIAAEPSATPVAGAAPEPTSPEPAKTRYTVAQLEAFRGKRGRKPAEFHAMFPKDAAAPNAAQAGPDGHQAIKVKATPSSRRASQPNISSAILGDHTIDELLEKIGTKGSKPAAFNILQRAAQWFVDHDGLESSDPLAEAVRTAPEKTRKLISVLLKLP